MITGLSDRLPSTSELMEQEQVSSLSVRHAYQALIGEGLVVAVPKKGFYVRESLDQREHPARQPPGRWNTDRRATGHP
ncbi:hypothetical protein GCM10022224_026890 [Nonomuraea antimicrobica]|uniref:HTH gntR-type domain-containing protein n=1 Tax=Nonomuraea antimicrobica TaxID=561173 RepID=A0ABP7BLE6_9ACTN